MVCDTTIHISPYGSPKTDRGQFLSIRLHHSMCHSDTKLLHQLKPAKIHIQRVKLHPLHALNRPKRTRVGRDMALTPNGSPTTVQPQKMSTTIRHGTCHTGTRLSLHLKPSETGIHRVHLHPIHTLN